VVKKTEWKEHVGIRDNIEIVKILELMYGLLCNLDLIIVPWQYLIDLVTIKQPLHTIIFLLLSTLTIMQYETIIPLFLLGLAVYILMILYDHKVYSPMVPDVKANIDFIKHMSETIGH
jgi:hypothetical protein